MSAIVDGSGLVPTPNRPNLSLSTKVAVQESEVLLPEKDPSQMEAIT